MRENIPLLKSWLEKQFESSAFVPSAIDGFRIFRKKWQDFKKAKELRDQVDITPVKSKKMLKRLAIGDTVAIQNQAGNNPKKWCNTGIITQILPNRKYTVMVNGSNRVTNRNRKFLRKILPANPTEPTNTPPTSDFLKKSSKDEHATNSGPGLRSFERLRK